MHVVRSCSITKKKSVRSVVPNARGDKDISRQLLKLSAWKVEDRGFEHRSGIQVSKKQKVSSPLTRKDSTLRGNVLDLRPPGLESRIMCLEGTVISFLSPSSGGRAFFKDRTENLLLPRGSLCQ